MHHALTACEHGGEGSGQDEHQRYVQHEGGSLADGAALYEHDHSRYGGDSPEYYEQGVVVYPISGIDCSVQFLYDGGGCHHYYDCSQRPYA